MMSKPTRKSRYIEAGLPMRCFQPSCKNLFDGKCYRGNDDRYYCSEICANEGFNADATLVPIKRRG